MLARFMRRTHEALACAVVGWLALSSGCTGGGAAGGGGTPTGPTTPTPLAESKPASELDRLMRTRMNTHYSKLVYLVFHAEGGPDFDAISSESTQMTEAVQRVLELPPPPIVQSEQARQVYVDYNTTLQRDNERFVAATTRKDIGAMSTTLTKIGDTCSACHHFFRVEIKDTN